MKHYRDEVEEKEAQAPASRCERRQQHKNANWNRTKHPENTHKLVSLVDMAQARNDTKDNRHSVARLAFRRFSRPTRPITSVTSLGIFRQQMPAVWTGHVIAGAWFGPCGRCVRILYAHFNY